jgi:hypothetical protein
LHLNLILEPFCKLQHSMDGNPSFKLSLDAVMHILQHLEPVDILATRAVGRRLFSNTGLQRQLIVRA